MKKLFLGLYLIFVISFACVINVSALEPTQTPIATEIPPTDTPEPPRPWGAFGDINEDGAVNAEDALIVLKYAAKIDDYSEIIGLYYRGDVDRNDALDATDALYILQYAADLIDSFEEIENFVPSTEVPEDYYIFTAGQTKNVTISEENEKVTFEFTPTESGYYRYHSSDDVYVEYGTIKDAEGNLLAERTDYAYIEYGWRPVFFGEFSFDYYFEAGKTYYLDAFLGEYDTGVFKVYLVKLSEAEKVIINGNELIKCPYGTEKELSISYEPEYSLGFIDSWTSSNPEIVTVDNQGKIKGVGIGKANITVTTTKGLTDSIEIEVTDHNEIKVGDVVSHMGVFEAIDYYKFVPDKDGEYIIKSDRMPIGNSYTPVNLLVYDSSFKNKLYSASGVNESLKCEFKAGEAYYIIIESNAGDNGLTQYIEIADIDGVLELSAGDTIQLPDLVSNSGSPYTWTYEVADEDEGVSVALVTDESQVVNPGDPAKVICTLKAEEPGEYIVHFALSNASWSDNIEVVERITYKVIVK